MTRARPPLRARAGAAAAALVAAALALPWAPAAAAQGDAAARGPTMHTKTAHVAALAVDGARVWVATRGGLERYDARSLGRERHYTTLDGLASNALVDVKVGAHATVVARTRGARCTLGADDRFACVPAGAAPAPRITPARALAGHRVTAEVTVDGARWVGTTGGLYVVAEGAPPRRVTPAGQICSNHVTDVVAWGGRTWLGTFAEGLCAWDGAAFRTATAPFHMINDLEVAAGGLYVAASEGLFVTRDGARFTRVHRRAVPRAATGLDRDGDHLWVTTPASLHRIRLAPGAAPSRSWWRPGGSTAVQDVAARGGVAWVATEDRGALRVDRDGVVLHDRAAGWPTSWALTVEVDGAGAAWVGTLRHGLLRVAAGGDWRAVDLPDAWLLRVREAPGALLVGTQGGAFVVRDGVPARIPHVPDPRVHELAPIGDALWVGTEGGTLELAFVGGGVAEAQAPARRSRPRAPPPRTRDER